MNIYDNFTSVTAPNLMVSLTLNFIFIYTNTGKQLCALQRPMQLSFIGAW